MGMKYIDGEMLKKAFLAGAKGLEAKKEWINELNVFPVPDGDTGTNMTMTTPKRAVVKSLRACPSSSDLESKCPHVKSLPMLFVR